MGTGYDGVHVFSPAGQRIGMILLPEICANICFGGIKRNRLFMAASQSLYSVYVGTQGRTSASGFQHLADALNHVPHVGPARHGAVAGNDDLGRQPLDGARSSPATGATRGRRRRLGLEDSC